MKGPTRHRWFLLSLCLLLSCFPAAAQTTTGSIVGTVTDQTGSLVPDAAVTVTNEATGIEFKATTDSSGNYVVTPIPVGRYSVTVETKGFKKAIRRRVALPPTAFGLIRTTICWTASITIACLKT